jgi:hypothetical protein
MNMMPASDQKHYNLYADLMTSTGKVTSIDKTGIENREKNNILLNLGNSHPLQGLETAAINSSESICNGSLTPSLMVGQMPTICSSFNKIVLNESFILVCSLYNLISIISEMLCLIHWLTISNKHLLLSVP